MMVEHEQCCEKNKQRRRRQLLSGGGAGLSKSGVFQLRHGEGQETDGGKRGGGGGVGVSVPGKATASGGAPRQWKHGVIEKEVE